MSMIAVLWEQTNFLPFAGKEGSQKNIFFSYCFLSLLLLFCWSKDHIELSEPNAGEPQKKRNFQTGFFTLKNKFLW